MRSVSGWRAVAIQYTDRKTSLSSLAGPKVRGVLYWVEQNFTQQQRQHIAVGYIVAHLVEQLHSKESAMGSNPITD